MWKYLIFITYLWTAATQTYCYPYVSFSTTFENPFLPKVNVMEDPIPTFRLRTPNSNPLLLRFPDAEDIQQYSRQYYLNLQKLFKARPAGLVLTIYRDITITNPNYIPPTTSTVNSVIQDSKDNFNGYSYNLPTANNDPTVLSTTEQPTDLPKAVGSRTLATTLNSESNNFDSLQKFNTKLFQQIGPENTQNNVVYSPISIQTLLSYLYIGAKGNTESELQEALELPAKKEDVVQLFMKLTSAKPQGDVEVVMANKVFYDEDLTSNAKSNELGLGAFNAEIESINFKDSTAAADIINKWVDSNTDGRISKIIDPSTLDANTRTVLVNAIHFKGKWEKEFSTSDTQNDTFYNNGVEPTDVQMMYSEETFRYGDLKDLNAEILELPYLKSDWSMLIILPKERNGLAELEKKLNNVDLNSLTTDIKPESIQLFLPKFSYEFELDMTESLKKLGIRDLFTDNADLGDFFINGSQKVSKVQHKAFIDVNEAGSEAAAASFAKLIPLSLPGDTVRFKVDHPFIFAIRSPQAVYFVGHVTNF
ncbi:serine protease inhibitor 42Dd-like [Teleopsis dalmanni]|uniref:serine protease inhibitor 42Dd-like n=1 Tax=Teleopsis dalmanni TaxID=139649 RepID=UPI0018CCE13B|nr:serine protease inhibitor 42Dd-like [Teleopsis dalmanni]